jgi:dipeptidyl-peptidase 4
MRKRRLLLLVPLVMAAAAMFAAAPESALGQDRLKSMPGYDQYQKMSKKIAGSVKAGELSVTWQEGGKAFEYSTKGKRYRYDIAAGKAVEIGKAPAEDLGADSSDMPSAVSFGPGPQKPERGRQVASATSPDGKNKASYRDGNLWLREGKDGKEIAITTDGSVKRRVKYGIASWVYGEELAQTTAMWWSPDSKKIAFYWIDETNVPDYILPLNQSSLQPKLDTEAYPKAGAPNPVVDIVIFDLESKKTVKIDARDGKPFEDSVVGHYIYSVSWSKDGSELIFHRTNRKQNILELVAADPVSGRCRVIVHEEWLPSWVANRPLMRYLSDNRRFLWISERSGFKNFYLYDLGGKLLATVTDHPFEVDKVVRIDEKAGLLYYTARSGDNHMKIQFHRVGLDGKNGQRLTDPAYHHKVDLAPGAEHFIDVIQTHDTPPVSRLVDATGKVLAELATSDTTTFDQLGLKRVELITYKAGDGVTDLHGMLHFPSNFDPAKTYPLLVTVYAGPNTNKAAETFALPNAMTEYGFLVAALDSRSASGRGKRFTDAIYRKLGVTEIDDQAAGVKSLWSRPYLDKNRVGIFGSSYGGYASAMCLLRYPEVFKAACASSSVTDWRHYDSIYTERYMWTPQENKEGYDAGSAMTYADNLKGHLMLFYGTQDNNVHPSNTLALVKALQRSGKHFDMQIGPDLGHAGISQPRMMEFFIENLVMRQ